MMSKRAEFEGIYNEFRTTELNKKYYGIKAKKIKRKLLGMDLLLAFFAGASAVSSYPFWAVSVLNVPVGPTLLAFGSALAVCLGIARPYLKLEDEHARLASMIGSYSAINHVMQDIVQNIKTQEEISDESSAIFKALRQVKGATTAQEDTVPDQKLIKKLQEEVNRMYPTSSFYYPDKRKT
ncbi:hypothetical protein [Shewanella baltica]|uniref:hypothetical protein n=1 Tax=Shewanella baltica TaxID=62322 RepID=UPI003CFE4395